MSDFEITTEGASQTTILRRDGLPIARFYAGRFNSALLNFITERLNTSTDPMKELCEALELFAKIADRAEAEGIDNGFHVKPVTVPVMLDTLRRARTALENAKGGGR